MGRVGAGRRGERGEPSPNWANLVTFGRIALVPVFVYLMYTGASPDPSPSRGPSAAERLGPWLAIVVFILAGLSDYLDGYLARRHRVTTLGTFLDPLADKILVGAALVTLVALRGFPLWAAIVIAARELAVSLLRSAALRRGRSIPASKAGKAKTATQIPMVLLWLLPRSGTIVVAQDLAVLVAVALTIFSGAQYFRRAGTLLSSRGVPAE
ncbi:MAG: CDP-diacylglycerol--glycerol-3-phosphate 3-phosphatidyltransferase [Actinomycetota bacterium]